MSQYDHQHDWLSLIEISGPFLAIPVLKEAFPQGLEELDGLKRKRLRQAYEEWREALETDDPQFTELHAAWIDEVLARGLELDEDRNGDVLKRADWCGANLKAALPEHGVTLSPDLAVVDEQRSTKPLMLIQTYGNDVDLDATLKLNGWAATPADRMVQLCRSTGCRLGLVTNGERWMLVDAPIGAVTTFASWYARIWGQEPITLQAFVHLLGIRRFFVDESEQLPALLDRSLKYQDEVTDALGEQVRRAVEVLIQALDKADQDRARELLQDVKEPELYEAALTVMMRLVFLLSAEERGLLLLGDERYEANYALSTLRMQLRKESEEILERRWDAWSRLLAIFRAVFGGIEHENLRLPALGGSLFDPDRFPFLEGRTKGSSWRTDTAKPLPIDNRTVLLLLEAIQQFQGRTLSYRALDVEQIGYVYEGLLERTVKRTAEVTLELDGTRSAKAPWVRLAELESALLDGAERLAELLQERSGSSASRVRNDLAKPVDDTLADRLLAACHGDTSLRNRIKPFAHLVRTDPWGYPLVYPAGAFIVITGSDRRETGTHYTPKSLTEVIVTETLTPIAYVGPAEGTPREQWVLKLPAELLDLKICDPAMGSGAFLVQACRWLADRLVEAWSLAEGSGKTVSVDGEVLDAPDTKEPLPRDTEARALIARRLIAERCLYGVDLNPLAVELAKLSIWLVTLAKGRPFGFLDHNMRCGDSLLGIHRLDQLTELSMTPTGKGQQRLFGQNIARAVHEAIELRQQLRATPIREIRDVETMAHLDADARRRLEVPECIANAFIGEVFGSGGNANTLDNAMASLVIQAGQGVDGDKKAIASIVRRAMATFAIDSPEGKVVASKPFHWPLEFPEVFVSPRGGFDCLIGNPPFMGGSKISTRLGLQYLNYLQYSNEDSHGKSDLCAYFIRNAFRLVSANGSFGFILTNTITQGASRLTALTYLLGCGGHIYWAIPSMKWPGNASVEVSLLCAAKTKSHFVHEYNDTLLEGASLSERSLVRNANAAFIGTVVIGKGFEISSEERDAILSSLPKGNDVIRPYINGSELNRFPDQKPRRWIIDFRGFPLDRMSAGIGYSGPTADEYPEILKIVRERVKPQRDAMNRKAYRERWWQFAERQTTLYKAIEGHVRVLVVAQVGKHLAFTYLPSNTVFDQKLIVFTDCTWRVFSVYQSSIHHVWARRPGSLSLRSDPTYTVEYCCNTFPMPEMIMDSEELDNSARSFFEARQEIMLANSIGLTNLYNRIHDPEDTAIEIEDLRMKYVIMDELVLRAYGWSDISLGHSFHNVSSLPKNDCIRFTIAETARNEVLRRLSELNYQRYEEEVAEGLHGGAAPGGAAPAPLRRRAAADSVQHAFDFDVDPPSTPRNANFASSVLNFLEARTGWHAKGDILAATGIPDVKWNSAISDLIANGNVERQGEKRGARYRVVTEKAKE